MNYEKMLEIANLLYKFFVENPEKEDAFFNQLKFPIEYLSFFYGHLVFMKLIKPLKDLDEESKKGVNKLILRIDPNRSVDKGMKMARTIAVLDFLSNN